VDKATKERVQQELKEEATKFLPDAVRQVAVLEYGDDPMVEPGEVMVRVITAERSPDTADAPPKHELMKEFRQQVTRRLPEVRRLEVTSEGGGSGGKRRRFVSRIGGDEGPPGDAEFTPVMARLRPPELEIVDTLIRVGIAPNRAEAVRWALARISERPAYAELRERTRDIERLKSEF
jgi:hypothetical protein